MPLPGWGDKTVRLSKSFLFCLPKSHFNPVSRANRDFRLDFLLAILPILINSLKPLQNPGNRVTFNQSQLLPSSGLKDQKQTDLTHFSQGKLLPDTDPRAPIEGDIIPTLRRPLLPAFGVVG